MLHVRITFFIQSQGGEFILEFKSGVTSSGYGFDVSWQCDEEKISQEMLILTRYVFMEIQNCRFNQHLLRYPHQFL